MQKEFSYPLIVAEIPQKEQHYHIIADEKQKKSLAHILKIPEVRELKADFNLKSDYKTSLLYINGHISSALVLQSVITLENFSKNYDFDFELVFDTRATLDTQKEEGKEWDDNTPEIVIGGMIDLGDIAVEQIALRLDDYPRQDGEEFNFKSEFDDNDIKKENPFAVLASLKK
ncbi:MAG: DUF177 domain-containing protein [Alphaproteobacteria bacterium]|nr:DUF177 domain-containing protein [Alphaproteobacteria bacterium]